MNILIGVILIGVRSWHDSYRRDSARRLAPRDFLPSAEALRDSEMVLREWLGLDFYRLRG